MRFASALVWLGASALVAAANEAEVPYTAFVLTGNAPVRSAPAKVHYPTTHLARGTKVEVYRHDPGGWLAIRPPQGSFSLVPAKYLLMADEPGIAHVAEARVAALVGTDGSPNGELLWQVQLKQGEAVELLGVSSERPARGDSSETWYKIAPPAGEFRWIHERFVTRDASAVVTDDQELAQDLPAPVAPPTPPEQTVQTKWDDGFVARKKRPSNASTHIDPVVPVAAPAAELNPLPSANSPAPAAPSASESDLLTNIALLDVELSLMVAGDTTDWNTGELRRRGEALLGQATSNLERGRARLLLNRIEEFYALENRHKEIRLAASPDDLADEDASAEPGRLNVDQNDEPATDLRERLNQPDAETAQTDFDGTGYLMPVHSKRSDVPPFALVDGTGRVVQYVTPAPGLNLHRYRKLEIGVFGQRGFVPTLQTPHVTAQRVIVLDRHR